MESAFAGGVALQTQEPFLNKLRSEMKLIPASHKTSHAQNFTSTLHQFHSTEEKKETAKFVFSGNLISWVIQTLVWRDLLCRC